MRALIFDCETTGLLNPDVSNLAAQPHVTEFFGHIVQDDGTIDAELNFLCNPGIPLTPLIVQITGITDAMVKDQPPFPENIERLCDLLLSSDCAVAHNLSFDKRVLDVEAQRAGWQIPWPDQLVCTVEQTLHLRGRRLKQQQLYFELFKEEFKGAHRARSDVEALTRIWLELRRRGDC